MCRIPLSSRSIPVYRVTILLSLPVPVTGVWAHSPLHSSLGCCFHKASVWFCGNIGEQQRFQSGTKFLAPEPQSGLSHWWNLECAGVDFD